MALTVLRLDGVTKLFGPILALDGVSLEIERGEIFTLLGPSGCGKTTTLRLVAGLEQPDGGEIILRDRVVASVPRRTFVAPHRRNLADVREGEYEGCARKLADPRWTPDFGPSEFVPRSGAISSVDRSSTRACK